MGRVPSNFAGKIDKLTIEIDHPRVAPADIQKLKESRNRCGNQKDGGLYEDESCGNGGFGVAPSQHRRADFLQQI
jgi:hypothetical protein